jgi:hypothetical protein
MNELTEGCTHRSRTRSMRTCHAGWLRANVRRSFVSKNLHSFRALKGFRL